MGIYVVSRVIGQKQSVVEHIQGLSQALVHCRLSAPWRPRQNYATLLEQAAMKLENLIIDSLNLAIHVI